MNLSERSRPSGPRVKSQRYIYPACAKRYPLENRENNQRRTIDSHASVVKRRNCLNVVAVMVKVADLLDDDACRLGLFCKQNYRG